MPLLLNRNADAPSRLQFGFHDDFFQYVSGDYWTATLTDSGTASLITTTPGGIIELACSDGSVADNDEAYIGSTAAFLPAANKPLYFEAKFKFTEANTDDANIMLGFCSTSAANAILDDGGGPPASYSGAVIFKVDGATVWNCETSVSTTQTTTTTAVSSTSSNYQYAAIEIIPVSSTLAEVSFLYSAGGSTDSYQLLAKQQWTYTSVAALKAFAGAKNGGANHEKLYVDYVKAFQLR